MKKTNFSIAVIFCLATAIFLAIASPIAADSNWACSALLCLSNPGGVTQYSECRPSINKLQNWLWNGKSFPGCAMGGGDGNVGVIEGKKPYLTCQDTYGPEYEPYEATTNPNSESLDRCSPAPGDYEDGYSYTQCTVCRKFMGSRKEFECADEECTNGRWIEKPYYDERLVKRNDKPSFIQVNNNGQLGERYYYKVKIKKPSIKDLF